MMRNVSFCIVLIRLLVFVCFFFGMSSVIVVESVMLCSCLMILLNRIMLVNS